MWGGKFNIDAPQNTPQNIPQPMKVLSVQWICFLIVNECRTNGLHQPCFSDSLAFALFSMHHRTLCRDREKVALGGGPAVGQSSPCCVVAIFIPESAISIKLELLPIHAAVPAPAMRRRTTFPIPVISLSQAR